MQSCQPMLVNKQYSQYRTCALDALKKANEVQETLSFCNDPDGVNYFKKGKVTSDLYPNGIEDYAYTFSNSKTYLMEGGCSSDKKYVVYQKNCKEFGQNYNAVDGACSDQLIQFPLQVESDQGTTKDIHLVLGQTYALSKNNFIRLDNLDYADKPVLTLWNQDEKGCRLVDQWIHANISNGKYAYFLDQFMEITKKDSVSIDAKLYSGNKAHEACNASSIAQKVRCLAFPKLGRFKIESAHFSRLFENKNEYAYNNLMLNYLEFGFNKLQSIFPALKNVKPYGDHWKFSFIASKLAAHSAHGETDSAVMINMGKENDAIEQKIIDSESVLLSYANQLLAGNLPAFDFSAELHEFTHIFLHPTALLSFPIDDSDKLSEGIAMYVESVGKYAPSGKDPLDNIWCGKSSFNMIGFPDLDGLSYADAFLTGKGYYNAGHCFFKRVQDTCGISSIDQMFKIELERQYHPFDLYPNILTTLKNACSEPSKFNEIMDDFGMNKNLLGKKNILPMLPSGILIQGPACK